MDRSAEPTTVLPVVARLFDRSSSKVVLLTRASLFSGPRVPGRMWICTVTVRVASFARLPKEHTVGRSASPGTPALHVPADGVTASTWVPAGTLSSIFTPVAVDGPLFLMVMV